ncbi:Putative phospholipase A2 [Cytospora mali]|uniref:Putative phospholipase n=1 Tax=Cytospora mali TaxID=578113 RepID=A0A194UV32_CYTMA|nr:Putative phospholipase A2 [Valsa mali var. pyri (nom. inval.)]
MQPFDEISTAELGYEDDVLSTHRTLMHQHPEPRYPIPKWMRPAGPRASSVLTRIRTGLIPFVRRWVSRVLPPLLSLLRPRLTLRYALFTVAALWVSYRVLISQPLFAANLPGYTGPYDVGALDIEVPLETPRRVSDIRFKADGSYAFEVDTVLFTLYYPAQHGPSRNQAGERYYWFPKPVSATAKGYARALGLDNFLFRGVLTGGLWLVAGGLQIPAKVGVPLLPAGAMGDYGDQAGDGRLPVMVFSHGMLSSRTDYTSRGVVVAAIEHRDGSSPASPIIRKSDGAPEWRYYFGLDDLDAESAALKEAQLSFREAEMEAAVDVLRRMNTGTSTAALNNSRAPVSFAVDMAAFESRLNTQNMTLAGHSYGATGALRALRSGPSKSLPFTGAVVLDPGKSSGRLNADVRVPLVVCHSSTWSKAGPSLFFGRPHFEVVREIVDGVNGICPDEAEKNEGGGDVDQNCREKGWFLTSLGTSHPSITDAPVLEPLLLSWTTGSTMDAQQGIRQYVLLTRDFVRYQHTGERDGLLSLSGSEEDDVVSREYDPKHNDGMPEQWRKYWQIHVAPS